MQKAHAWKPSQSQTRARPRNRSGYTACIVNKKCENLLNTEIESTMLQSAGSNWEVENVQKKRPTLMLVSSQTFNEVPWYTTPPGHVSPTKRSPHCHNSKAPTYSPEFNYFRQLQAKLHSTPGFIIHGQAQSSCKEIPSMHLPDGIHPISQFGHQLRERAFP
jgi:hypothetical protein